MKLALLLPGYLDSPDYQHFMLFDKRLVELGYTVQRVDLGNLWETGDASNYKISYFIDQIRQIIISNQDQKPEEVVLIGHSMGAFTAIIAGSRLNEVTKIISLCPPPDFSRSKTKWQDRVRISERELPSDPSKSRIFTIPDAFIEDALSYSAVEEVKGITKPVMIFIALADTVVPPEDTERIVTSSLNPLHVVRQPNMGHDFRNSQQQCSVVMNEIEKFL